MTKILAWISWVIFLTSATAEYGLDIDFPLTPPVWLAIAAIVFFATAMQVRLSKPSHPGCGHSGTSLSRLVRAPELSRTVYPLGYSVARSRLDDSSQNDDSPNAVSTRWTFRPTMDSDGNTIRDVVVMADAILLRPEVDRGPPSAPNKAPVSSASHQAQRPVPVCRLPSFLVVPLSVQQTAQIKPNVELSFLIRLSIIQTIIPPRRHLVAMKESHT